MAQWVKNTCYNSNMEIWVNGTHNKRGDTILKSCSYCGKIHDKKDICPKKPIRKKFGNKNNKTKFRSTNAWARKREQIKKRDNYLCQVCLMKLHSTVNQYNYNDIEVHHIVKLEDNFDLRLEDDNLISLCAYHHHMADSGIISNYELTIIVQRHT